MRELRDSESTYRVTLYFLEKWKMNFYFSFSNFFTKKRKIKQKLNSFFIFQFSRKTENWKMNHTEFVFHFSEEVKKWNYPNTKFIFHFSSFRKKWKLKNELHKIRFSFSKEVKKMKLSWHFSFFLFHFCEKVNDTNVHAFKQHHKEILCYNS